MYYLDVGFTIYLPTEYYLQLYLTALNLGLLFNFELELRNIGYTIMYYIKLFSIFYLFLTPHDKGVKKP